MAVALSTAVFVPTVFAQAQNLTPEEQAARTRAIAQARANGPQLTVFDREGNAIKLIGERHLYQPSLFPDQERGRVATAPSFHAGTPRLLFRLPQSLQPNAAKRTFALRSAIRFWN